MTTGTQALEQELLRDFDTLRGKMQEVLQGARRDIRDAEREAEEAEEEAKTAEELAAKAKGERDDAIGDAEHYFERYKSLAGSLQRHVWRDDKAGATYCVGCGDTWPIHRHDCPFGAVE